MEAGQEFPQRAETSHLRFEKPVSPLSGAFPELQGF